MVKRQGCRIAGWSKKNLFRSPHAGGSPLLSVGRAAVKERGKKRGRKKEPSKDSLVPAVTRKLVREAGRQRGSAPVARGPVRRLQPGNIFFQYSP